MSKKHLVHRLSRITVASVGLFSAAALGFSLNKCPYTGRFRLLTSTLEQDLDVGNRISHTLVSNSDYVLPSSHPLSRILQKIVDKLVLRSSGNLRWSQMKVIVISDSSKQIFSLPNGDIIVHAGAIGDVNTKAELAGLLSNAISHALLRHSSEVVSFKDLVRLPSGFLYSLVPVAGGATSIWGGLISWLLPEERKISEFRSPKQETEADAFAVKVMQEAGYDAQALIELLRRQDHTARANVLLQQNGFKESGRQTTDESSSEDLLYWKRRISVERER